MVETGVIGGVGGCPDRINVAEKQRIIRAVEPVLSAARNIMGGGWVRPDDEVQGRKLGVVRDGDIIILVGQRVIFKGEDVVPCGNISFTEFELDSHDEPVSYERIELVSSSAAASTYYLRTGNTLPEKIAHPHFYEPFLFHLQQGKPILSSDWNRLSPKISPEPIPDPGIVVSRSS